MTPQASGLNIVIEDDTNTTTVDPATGTTETKLPDGGVVVVLDAARPRHDGEKGDFYANLADKIDVQKLGQIANELSEAISADDASRQGYLENRSRGLDLLGIKLSAPRATVGDSSAPVEGMSSVTNPLLLENVLRGWANTVGELLPANGPLKVRDDGDETVADDELAEALERDLNHYLTKGAPEYYPDTSHMILWGPYFGGSGFKKVYRCPMRRRPVSESVDAKDLIVSDTTKDLRSCGRITHQIAMRPSVMKRMQLIGAYRDVTLTQPTPQTNTVDQKIAGIQGTAPTQSRPEDQPYTLWESQCELDLPQFAPETFKNEGIPLPYLVTMDKDSREILAIRRDWREDDEDCTRQHMYVRYPFIPGPGFYCTGMLNLLGNASAAMTAAWREALDAGMFASFPGGLIAKSGSRQNTSNFRMGPGEFASVETNGLPIDKVAMGLPYKDVTPGLMALMDKILAQAEKVGGVADIPAAEGIANVPVGTMLAQVEQATKVMSAAHKGMHQAQSEEFDLILDLFRAHPEDFLRSVKTSKGCPAGYWNEQKFVQALDDCALVPVSDPNVPSHIHRVTKAIALFQMLSNPMLAMFMSAKEVLLRCLRAIREDPNGLVVDPSPQAAPPDPKAIEAQAKVMKAQADAALSQGKLAALPQQTEIEAAKLQTQREIAATDLQKELVIHQSDQARLAHEMDMQRGEHALQTVKTIGDLAHQAREHSLASAQHGLDVSQAQHDRAMDVAEHKLNKHEVLHPPKPAPKKS